MTGVRATKNAIAAQDDFDYEPIPGLPEKLPEGERVLWSDVPDWKAVALDVFHIRAIALYALAILLWRFSASVYDGATTLTALANTGLLAAIFGFGLALMGVLAYATAKSTRYTITNKRVVLRIGVALTMSVNLPFKQVVSADYRPAPFGTGAIALSLKSSGGLGYLVLWPHVRPFYFTKPQPMLRGIKDGERVARVLSAALIAAQGETAPSIHVRVPAGKTRKTAEKAAVAA